MRRVALVLALLCVAAEPASAHPPRWGGVVRWHGGYRMPRVQMRWGPYWAPVAPIYRPRVYYAPPPVLIVRRRVYREAPPPDWRPAPPPPQWQEAPPPPEPPEAEVQPPCEAEPPQQPQEPYEEPYDGDDQEPPPAQAPPPAEAPPPVDAPQPAQGDALEWEVARLVNVERARAGLPDLVPNELLSEAARAHSEEMIRLGYFDHHSPVAANKTMTERMRNVGITGFGQAGENIAMGTFGVNREAEELVRAWMDSPGHRRNILDPGVRFIGVGIAWRGGELFATQLFTRTVEVQGRPQPQAPPPPQVPGPDSAGARLGVPARS